MAKKRQVVENTESTVQSTVESIEESTEVSNVCKNCDASGLKCSSCGFNPDAEVA